jgi:membrane protein YdbS with pleckstrin-like domain
MRVGTVIIVIWLIIGAIAAGQRHYYNSSKTNCAKSSTVVLTILAGPLNYVGVNPKVTCPKPSR